MLQPMRTQVPGCIQQNLQQKAVFKMPRNPKCVVGGCKNEAGEGVWVYKFPKDRKQEMNWTRFVKKTRQDFVVVKNSVICSDHFSDDSFDQAFKLKQEFGLLTEKNLKIGPPLLPTAVPTIIDKSSTSSADVSGDFFLSPEAQKLGPSGKKPRLASEKRAKKKFVNDLLRDPVVKPQPDPVKKNVQFVKDLLEEKRRSDNNLPTSESPSVSWMSTICENVQQKSDRIVEQHSPYVLFVTNPLSSVLPVRSTAELILPPHSSSLPQGLSLQNSLMHQKDPVHISTVNCPVEKNVEASAPTEKDASNGFKDHEVVTVAEPVLDQSNAENTVEPGNSIIGEPELVSLDHGYATGSGMEGDARCKAHPSNSGGSEENNLGSTSGTSGSHEANRNSFRDQHSFQTASQNIVDERKFIVTESALDELVAGLRCPKCSSPPKVVNKSDPVGTLLKISAWCENDHQIIDWKSQPVVAEIPLLDVLCCAALLFAANTFNQICNFMGFLNVNFVAKKQYNSLLNKHLSSVVNGMWTKERNRNYIDLRNDSHVVLSGHGCHDIPGFCTYTLLDENTGKVVHFESKSEVDQKYSANLLEKAGLTECLDQVLKRGIRVKSIATDQHAGIEEMFEERYRQHNVKHDYHMRHLSKQLAKKISQRAKLTDNSELESLAPNLQNHLYWAASTCDGDPKVLQEKWTSVIDLVPKVTLHETEGKVHVSAPVSPEGDNAWIRISSKSCKELRSIVYDPQFLYDVGLLKEFYHSNGMDKYQSVMRKYCPKRERCSQQGMLARVKLAALEHNANFEGKKSKRTKGRSLSGSGEAIIVSKEKQKWMENSLFAGRCYSYVYDMLVDVVKRTLHQKPPSELCLSSSDSRGRDKEGEEMGTLPSSVITIPKQLEGSNQPPPSPWTVKM